MRGLDNKLILVVTACVISISLVCFAKSSSSISAPLCPTFVCPASSLASQEAETRFPMNKLDFRPRNMPAPLPDVNALFQKYNKVTDKEEKNFYHNNKIVVNEGISIRHNSVFDVLQRLDLREKKVVDLGCRMRDWSYCKLAHRNCQSKSHWVRFIMRSHWTWKETLPRTTSFLQKSLQCSCHLIRLGDIDRRNRASPNQRSCEIGGEIAGTFSGGILYLRESPVGDRSVWLTFTDHW